MKLSRALEGSKDGTSKKSHLLKVWQQTGRMPDELEKVMSPPLDFIYLWNWLQELNCPMAFSELKAWQELTKRKLLRWEIMAMVRLDGVRAHG